MDGFVNVLKPPRMTSREVVHHVRTALGVKKKGGHTGTLDPGAIGVLVVCLGRATRLAQYVTDTEKEYRAEITFGSATDTGDAFGRVIMEADGSELTESAVRAALPVFTGEITQIPPMMSAKKINGRRLYKLARAGITVERPPRQVTISKLAYIDGSGWGWGSARPRVAIDVTCSKGTYIRTLCEDLGRYLGCVAHMSFLVRTRVGAFTIADSVLLNDLSRERNAAALIPMEQGLPDYPVVKVKSGAVKSVQSGARLYPSGVMEMPPDLAPGTVVKLCGPEGLIALAETTYDEVNHGRIVFKSFCVLSGG